MMNKREMLKSLTKLKMEEIDLEECILQITEYEEFELVEELEVLHEITSKVKFNRMLDELILDIESISKCRKINHKDLMNKSIIKRSTVDSLNEIIRKIKCN